MMPNNLSGQVDLSSATEGTALGATTDVASFTDGTLTDTAANFTATIDWGDGVTTTGSVVGASGSFTVEGGHTYTDDDAVFPVVTVTRTTDNSQLVMQSFGFSPNDADNLVSQGAPTLSGNPNVALTNVTVATFSDSYLGNGTGDFTVNIDWGDGTTTAGTLALNGSTYTVTGSHSYATAGQFTINTFMNDGGGDNSFGFAQTQAAIGFGGTEVFNAATETFAVPTGTTVATFVDNSNLPSTDYTAAIDWGDGTTTAGVVSGSIGSFTVTSASDHTYADEGNFIEVVTITRTTDSATIAPSGTVAVFEDDNLNAAGVATINGSPGVALNNVTVATFSDSNTQNIAGDFVATIGWGDGTSSTGTISGSSGSFTVTDSHTYTQNGQDTITVGVFEDPSDGQGFANASAQSTALIGLAPGSGSAISATEGTAIPAGTQVATFTDSNAGDTAASFTASIDWGDGTTTTGTVSGSNGSFTVAGGPHTYADEGQDGVTTTVTRTADNATATITGQATVGDADVLSLTANNISGFSGQPLNNVQVATFTDTYVANVASDFTTTIDWGDGTTTGGTVSGGGGAFTVDGSHTYTTGGTDQLKVSVGEDQAFAATAVTGTATATIAVRTLAGQMVLNSATEATVLPNNTVVATFTDNIVTDAAGDFTATINWGDGVTTTGTVVGSAGSFTVEGGHTYADEGSDPASVTLTHTADQAQATASGTVAVAEGDSLTPQGTTIATTTNQAFSGTVATFSDTDTANVAGDFAASIAWGDGTTTIGTVSGSTGAFTVNGSHSYALEGKYTVTVEGADDAPGTANFTVASTATVSLPGTVVLTSATEGTALPNNTPVATFTDSNPGDTASSFTASIAWGDGATTAGTVVGSTGTFTVEGGHSYADEGSDLATVTLTHTSDQVQSTASGTVAVAEGDVLAGQGLHIKPKAGEDFSGTVATFSDTDTANVAGDFTATINWGDGTTTTGTVWGSNGSFGVDGDHTYAEPGREDVLVTLADDAPGTATATADTKATVSSSGNGHDNALVVPNGPSNPTIPTIPTVLGGLGGGNLIWQISDGMLSSWLTNAITPFIGTALSGGQLGSADTSTTNSPADLLFQNTNGGTMHLSAPDPSGPPSVGDLSTVSASPTFSGADGGPSLSGLGGAGSTVSSLPYGTFTVR
jgi:hypothetical protein